MDKKEIEKIFTPYDICVKLKEIGFKKPCLGVYYTDDDVNNLKDKDYRKKFVPLEYIEVQTDNVLDVEFEPNFIYNKESKYYISAPTWEQAELFFEDYGYIFTLNSTFDDTNNKIVCYWFNILKHGKGLIYESDFIFKKDKSKLEVKELMFGKIIEDINK